MTAPSQQAAPTKLCSMSEDPSVQDAIAALAPARVSLVASSENPEPGRRAEFDTWGCDPEVHLGVPEGATRESVIEMLWQLRLLGSGWPDPCASDMPPRGARLAGQLMVAAARSWAADDRDGQSLREDLGALMGRLDADDAHLELFCLAGACEGSERVAMFAQVAQNAPKVARRAEALLAQAGRVPLTPEEATDALSWLLSAE